MGQSTLCPACSARPACTDLPAPPARGTQLTLSSSFLARKASST